MFVNCSLLNEIRAKALLTLFSVEHMSALDRVVVDITLSRFPARVGLTTWGAV
jgi:hypothetical protein